MDIESFNFKLKKEMIATRPVRKREESKLMIIDRKSGTICDKKFYNIIDYFKKGDLLVLNDTKVIPARLIAKKSNRGKAEILLLNQLLENVWEAMAKRVKVNDTLYFLNSKMTGEVIEKRDELIKIKFSLSNHHFWKEVYRIGKTPLPPYIIKKLPSINERFHRSRYQSVFARENGSVAAPTASLHFSKSLLREIEKKGVEIAYLTLNIGLGTFMPVRVKEIDQHKMHKEYFSIKQSQYLKIVNAKNRKRRVIACGTTVVRVLEHLKTKEFFEGNLNIKELTGWTDIYIYPGYKFKNTDAIITNFHLPKSSLLVLVSAFMGLKLTKKAYRYAVDNDYRFYSYGDAMLIK